MPGGASGVTLWPCMWAKEGTVSLHAVSRDKLESCVCAVMRKGRGGVERACTSTCYYILSHRNFPLPSPSLHPLVDLGHGRGKTGLEPKDDAPAVHELVLVAFGRGRDLGVRAVLGGGGRRRLWVLILPPAHIAGAMHSAPFQPARRPTSSAHQAQATLQGILRVPDPVVRRRRRRQGLRRRRRGKPHRLQVRLTCASMLLCDRIMWIGELVAGVRPGSEAVTHTSLYPQKASNINISPLPSKGEDTAVYLRACLEPGLGVGVGISQQDWPAMHDHLAADPKVLGGQAEWQQCSPEAGHPLALAPRLQGPGDSGGRLRVRQVHSMHRVQRWPDAPTQTAPAPPCQATDPSRAHRCASQEDMVSSFTLLHDLHLSHGKGGRRTITPRSARSRRTRLKHTSNCMQPFQSLGMTRTPVPTAHIATVLRPRARTVSSSR